MFRGLHDFLGGIKEAKSEYTLTLQLCQKEKTTRIGQYEKKHLSFKAFQENYWWKTVQSLGSSNPAKLITAISSTMSILPIDAVLFYHTEPVKTPLKDSLNNKVPSWFFSCEKTIHRLETYKKKKKKLVRGIHAAVNGVNCLYRNIHQTYVGKYFCPDAPSFVSVGHSPRFWLFTFK